MIPVLFNENETVFTTQGIGALSDAITCTVTEERNGMYELEITYPITGIHYSDIQYQSIIAAIPSPYRTRQPFRVYKMTKPLNGIVTVYARHLSYDLNAIPVNPFSATGITNAFTLLKNNMAVANNFAFVSGITNTTSKVVYTTPTACRSILGGIQGSILDIFGGEYEWDNWTVRLWAHRGADNGVTIRYGKNMTDLSAETDGENVVNGIYPYWQKDDVLVTCNPAVIWVSGLPHDKAVPVDFSNDFEEQPTPAQLQARAEQYLSDNNIGEIPTSIDVSFVDLSKMDEYKGLIASLEKCDLCDTVSVQYKELGVNVKSEVVKIVTDVLKEKYESMEVGMVRADIAQTIAGTENKIDKVVRPDGSLVAEMLKGFINGSLVNLYAQYDVAEPAGAFAILFECNDPANPLYGAMALGTQGLMISKEKKADGTGWDWSTAITASGINAALIVLGILSDKTGQNWWNLDTGEFHLSAETLSINGIAKDSETVTDVYVEYAVGDSTTVAPTSGWSTGSPTWTEGKYIWQRTVAVKADGTQEISNVSCIQGADGKPGANGDPGADGVSATNIRPQYYLSTSSTQAVGGAWSYSQPPWEAGKYIWARSEVTYSNGTIDYTPEYLAAAINSANQSAANAEQAVTDLDDSLNQQGVFNRLTNNGQAQGIWLENGDLYGNGKYVEFEGATIGGWEVNTENLASPSSTLVLDSAEAAIYTQNNNGNKGAIFHDEGIDFYSWYEDGRYIGQLADYIHALYGEELLMLSASIPLCLHDKIFMSDTFAEQNAFIKGVTIRDDVQLVGELNIGFPDVGKPGGANISYDHQQDILTVKSGHINLDGTVVSQRNNIVLGGQHLIRFDWTASGLQLYVDNTPIGIVQTK